jgi:thioredoxin 1
MNIRRLAPLFVAAFALAAQAASMYPDVSRADADIAAGLAEAAKTHKRVLVDFGGDWCTDCKVLDVYMKRPENAAIVSASFVVVHVNVGNRGITDNFAVGKRYGIALEKGVPALAVLESDGRLVFAQKAGEFEDMRHMDVDSVNKFLVKWR